MNSATATNYRTDLHGHPPKPGRMPGARYPAHPCPCGCEEMLTDKMVCRGTWKLVAGETKTELASRDPFVRRSAARKILELAHGLRRGREKIYQPI